MIQFHAWNGSHRVWGLGLLAVRIPIRLFFGRLTGFARVKAQPAKFTAIEEPWKRGVRWLALMGRDYRPSLSFITSSI